MTSAAVRLIDLEPETGDDVREILAGLSRSQKSISPKYFYDEKGSQLFESICELEEYYPTRTELAIVERNLSDIVAAVGPRVAMVEYGSGASIKTRILLKHLEDPVAYMPVDISRDHLLGSAESIAREFPDIEVLPVCADFTQPFDVPLSARPARRTVIYFPGSTIGNFDREAASQLLAVMRAEAGQNGGLLIGVDLVKAPETLERAYNDASGLTAEFNLNMLERINRDFGGDFDVDAFEHIAVYDTDEKRIEMRLVSTQRQSAELAGERIDFNDGEYIITEHSHKFTIDGFGEMARSAGFRPGTVWTDTDANFAVMWFTVE